MLLTVGKWYQVCRFTTLGTDARYAKRALAIALAQRQRVESTSRELETIPTRRLRLKKTPKWWR